MTGVARRRIVITPVFNESKVIADVIRRISSHADLVIAVNDASTDSTAEVLRAWAHGNERAILVDVKKNGGASVALRKGYSIVAHLVKEGMISPEDLVIEIDSDGQHDPRYISELCDRFERSHDIDVVLARRDFSVYPRYKVWGNRFLTIAASLLGGARYIDVESNFRVMPARRFPDLLRWYGGYRYSGAFEVGIILGRLGLRTDNTHVIEVPLYRHGASAMDGFHVLAMGVSSLARWMAGWARTDVETFTREACAEAVWPGWYGRTAPEPVVRSAGAGG